jgi:probable F420-dependent oxidoreductase
VTTVRNSAGRPRIKVGLHALGVGSGSKSEVVSAVAAAADARGFATLWCGEHVVMVDSPRSRYPYSADGLIAVPPDADWLDPLLGLSFIAAHTRRITLATGILLLPEHNPLIIAKQAATLDVLSGGRFTLGVGVGWSAEEFEALGVRFERRGARTTEYIAALRRVWASDVASFSGEFVKFDAVRVYPKPVRERKIPIIIGGTTDAALRRAAVTGDGWYGFSLAAAEVLERVRTLAAYCVERDRDPSNLTVAVSLSDGGPELLPEMAAAGVTEVVVVAAPPSDPEAAADWVHELAEHWIRNPADHGTGWSAQSAATRPD